MDITDEIRELLIKHGVHMSENELQTTITELQYLVDVWFNDVERQLFNGKTLDELIGNTDL